MKKNILGWALLSLICGVVFISIGLFDKSLTHSSTIFGMGFGFLVGAITAFHKYFYWLKPANKIKYQEKLKKEKINENDERKIMLKEKSGRISYNIMLVVLSILYITFTFIGVEKWIIFTLGGVIAFQYLCGVVIYYHLSQKI